MESRIKFTENVETTEVRPSVLTCLSQACELLSQNNTNKKDSILPEGVERQPTSQSRYLIHFFKLQSTQTENCEVFPTFVSLAYH